MIIWCKFELSQSITVIKKEESYIWLKINKQLICAEQLVYICAVAQIGFFNWGGPSCQQIISTQLVILRNSGFN